MPIKAFKPKPKRTAAAKYEGTITDSNYLMGWVKKINPRQTLEPEGEDGRLVLHGADGTVDLFVGWYLVYNDKKHEFEVLDPSEFNETYEEM